MLCGTVSDEEAEYFPALRNLTTKISSLNSISDFERKTPVNSTVALEKNKGPLELKPRVLNGQ